MIMNLAKAVSKYNRNRKWETFLSEFSPAMDLKVLDVGYSSVEEAPRTISNYLEKYYPYPDMITALGIQDPTIFRKQYPGVKALQYDGGTFPFKDKSFDICWSNAVIEHVGNLEQQVNFIKEIRRVSKSAFVTTPNRFFPVETHTLLPLLHYLPKTVFDRILICIGKEWATGNYMSLLSEGSIRSIMREAEIENYRLIKNRIIGIPLDFVILF